MAPVPSLAGPAWAQQSLTGPRSPAQPWQAGGQEGAGWGCLSLHTNLAWEHVKGKDSRGPRPGVHCEAAVIINGRQSPPDGTGLPLPTRLRSTEGQANHGEGQRFFPGGLWTRQHGETEWGLSGSALPTTGPAHSLGDAVGTGRRP